MFAHKEYLAALCDGLNYCVFFIHRQSYEILYASCLAQSMLRIKAGQILNESVFGSNAFVIFRDIVAELEGGATVVRKFNLSINDEIVCSSLTFALYDEKFLFVDISQNSTLVEQNNPIVMLEEKLSAITRLSDGIAHNLRSPLMALRGISDYMVFLVANWEQVLAQGCLDCKLKKNKEKTSYLLRQMRDDIRNNVTVITDIINDLRAYNQVDRSNDFVETDIYDLICKVIKMLVYNTKLASEIIFVPPDKKLPLVHCIPSDIQVVLTNLIENAIEQIISAKVKQGKIFVSVKQQDQNVVIKVKDNGGGISEDILKHNKLFEPFITTKKNEGTGLGLHSSFKIVKEHRGNIYAKNHNCKIGKGAEFVVVLPIRKN